MRCIEDVGNQKLVDALQLQGNLIGNLAHEKARMTAQFSLLDWELTRRAQRGTLVMTREAPGTASVRGGGAEQGTGAANEGNREHSPASGQGRGSGNGNRERPDPPRGSIPPSVAPVDLANRESCASTVYVGNIHRDVSELEILELFNSVGGIYGNREPNIVVAVNFVYHDGNFGGQAYLLYSTAALAEFAVRRLRYRELCCRQLWVCISNHRFNTRNLGLRGNTVGNSRGGAHIWDCAPAAYTCPRD